MIPLRAMGVANGVVKLMVYLPTRFIDIEGPPVEVR